MKTTGINASVEPTAPTVIPTLHKAKISHLLSYPLGAEIVSEALNDVPQFDKLILRFFFWSDSHLRKGDYEFIRIEYWNHYRSTEWTKLGLHRREQHYRWEVVIQPVPRVFRNRVRHLAISEALPQIREWLKENGTLERQGAYVFAFFYDEKSDAVRVERFDKLEPTRA